MDNKKILLIGPLPDPITGMSIANYTLWQNLEKYHSQYRLITANTSYDDIANPGNFSFNKLFYFLRFYKHIFKIFKSDIIYITPGQTFLGVMKYIPFIFLSKILRKQIIIHIHGDYLYLEYKISSNWKKFLMRITLSMSEKGIVLSESLKKNLTPFISENKIYILSNFVEDILFNKTNCEKPLDHLRIIYLSNLMPQKGIYDLLEALLILERKNINFSALIAGKIMKEEEPKILSLIEKLSKNVKYLGIVKGQAKKDALENSNVFILPTFYFLEGQPISILEAMATSNIILTTKIDGINDIFKEGMNGFYVNKNDPEDIAEKLISISKNLSSYQSIMLHNSETAKQQYKVKSFIDNFVKILES